MSNVIKPSKIDIWALEALSQEMLAFVQVAAVIADWN